MKGYDAKSGWMGWMPDGNGGGKYQMFDTEKEYQDAYEEVQAS